MRDPEDRQIIGKVLAGNTDAFELLVSRYRDRVFRIVGARVPPDEIDDVAQQVFIRAFRSLPKCRKPEAFGGWLSAIAVRTCCDFWRGRYRRPEIALSDCAPEHCNWMEEVLAAESPDEMRELEQRGEAVELLRSLLAELPPADREVLQLVHIEERSVAEAARLLGWTRSNVKVRAMRARHKLRRKLELKMKQGH